MIYLHCIVTVSHANWNIFSHILSLKVDFLYQSFLFIIVTYVKFKNSFKKQVCRAWWIKREFLKRLFLLFTLKNCEEVLSCGRFQKYFYKNWSNIYMYLKSLLKLLKSLNSWLKLKNIFEISFNIQCKKY